MDEKGSAMNPNFLYDKLVLASEDEEVQVWGKIPKSIDHIPQIVDQTPNLTDPSILERLVEVLRTFHKKNNIYTPEVENSLQSLVNGSVLGGQQPVILGGPSFIANKIAAIISVTSRLSKEGQNLAPVFMIGDYDGFQKELYRTYFPNPISGNATILDAEQELNFPEDVAIHTVPIPTHSWLESIFNQLEASIRGFVKQIKDTSKRNLLMERFFHIKTLLMTLHEEGLSFTDYFARIWGTIANKISKLGIVFFPTSLPEIREIYASELFKMVSKQEKFVSVFNQYYDLLVEKGYDPTLPKREDDYLPFFYECNCSGFRVSLVLQLKEGKKKGHGHCKLCKTAIFIDLEDEKEFFKHIRSIGPRVDSSQAIFQDLLNIKVRISGPGEIAYYALVAPALKSIDWNLPIFFKYKRSFYNTPWGEKLGKLLAQRKLRVLHDKELFALLRKRIDAIRNEDQRSYSETELEISKYFDDVFIGLLKHEKKMDVQKYLSWMFGRFTPEKYGQEVSWIWIDMALQTGLNDYAQTYLRMYHTFSMPGYKQFLNTGV